METWLPIIIQLVAGAIGGNLAGSSMKGRSLGGTGNAVAGALGGLGGGQLLGLLGVAGGAGGLDVGSIVSDVVGGGAGGAIVTALVGMLRGAGADK